MYCYLPAAATLLKEPVFLLNKYKLIIDSRQELFSLKDQIIWLESEEELIQTADSLVISRRPIDQEALVSKCLAQTNLKRIMFEKPLATSPHKAQKILDQVVNSDKYCSVGFTFRFTNWAMQLKEKLLNGEFSEHESINLSWHFMADHFNRNIESWKMDHTQGGGAIRFYGIHVIALLAELGYKNVASSSVSTSKSNSKLNYYRWSASFTGSQLPTFFFNLDSKSNSSCFKVKLRNDEQALFEGLGPFDPVLNNLTVIEQDTRCFYLTCALQELIELSKPYPTGIEDCIKLWQLVEAQTVII